MNYDNIKTGDFTPINLGGHHMIIKRVEEMKSKSGKDMLKVAFDFAPTDAQKNYFADQFASDIRPDKKWPNSGISYVVATDDTGNTSRSFKTFITSVEESNPGFMVNWCDGAAFVNQFVGKKIGGVFGKVEDEYNGERKLKTNLRWFCADQKADNAKVPDDKLLPAGSSVTKVASVPAPTPVEDIEIPL